MKKTIAILVLLAMLLSMVACTASPPEADENPGGETSENQGNQNAGSGGGTEEKPGKTEPKVFDQTATIEETVLWDKNNVKITATDLTYGNYSAELELLIENNSEEELSFVSGSVGYDRNSINGYMAADGFLNCDVAAGKKAMDTIAFSYSELMLYGIYVIADIEIGFDIEDKDYNDTYTGPLPIKTSAAETYDYETPHYRNTIAGKDTQLEYGYTVPYFSDAVCYAEKGLTIASSVLMTDEDGEELLLLEVVNDSEKTIFVSSENIRFNDLLVCSSTWSCDAIVAGKTGIVSIGLSSVLEAEFYAAYGIDKIGAISVDLTFTDEKNKTVAPATTVTVAVPGIETAFDQAGVVSYDKGGVYIVSKGIYEDPSTYSDDLHLLLLVQNNAGRTIKLDDVSNSLTVNNFMVSCIFYTQNVEDGDWVAVDVELMGYSLEDIKVSLPTEIQTLELGISIKTENYKELDTADICLTFAAEE